MPDASGPDKGFMLITPGGNGANCNNKPISPNGALYPYTFYNMTLLQS